MTKRRILDDDGANPPQTAAEEISLSTGASRVERHHLSSGLFLYRYRLSSYPPNVQEHDEMARFLGQLISKLLVATGKRLEPFVCVDGRHLDDVFFTQLRESGTAWRALMGFPLIPGFHPFRYLPIAYHINNREAWNAVGEQFLGTGGTTIYLTGLAADEFFTKLIQLLLVRDGRGATSVFPVYLPEAVLGNLGKVTGSLKPMLECFEIFIGENPSEHAIDIVSAHEIQDLVSAILDSRSRTTG